MSTAKGIIEGGVCGFVTEVVATSEDGQHVSIGIETSCEKIRKLSENLTEVDAYAELGAGVEGVVWSAVHAVPSSCCCGCVVPAGILKTVQVAAGVALPQTASVQVERA